jgi:hypothetical protein
MDDEEIERKETIISDESNHRVPGRHLMSHLHAHDHPFTTNSGVRQESNKVQYEQ